MTGLDQQIPLIVHVLYALGTGGLENGLVNIINRTPPNRYRHALVCWTGAGAFASRIVREDVPIIALGCRPGHDFSLYARLWSTLRSLHPAIVHTRNLAALEAQIPALFLRDVGRVHGEHGRDIFDIDGSNRKYNALRRIIRPIVHRYIAVSQDLAGWLEGVVGVRPTRIAQIYNGSTTAFPLTSFFRARWRGSILLRFASYPSTRLLLVPLDAWPR